jgi:hypothetical protein
VGQDHFQRFEGEQSQRHHAGQGGGLDHESRPGGEADRRRRPDGGRGRQSVNRQPGLQDRPGSDESDALEDGRGDAAGVAAPLQLGKMAGDHDGHAAGGGEDHLGPDAGRLGLHPPFETHDPAQDGGDREPAEVDPEIGRGALQRHSESSRRPGERYDAASGEKKKAARSGGL